MMQNCEIQEKIISAVTSLTKYLPSKFEKIGDSPTATTNGFKSNQSFSFSDLQSILQLKNHALDDSSANALEILNEIQTVLERNKIQQNLINTMAEHLLNFIQNFQLVSQELKAQNSILFKSFKYSLQHLTSMVYCVGKCPIEKNNKFKENLLEINTTIQTIQHKIDKIQQFKETSKHPKLTHLQSQLSLKTEIIALNKKLKQYEEERETFIKVHQYYESQLIQPPINRNQKFNLPERPKQIKFTGHRYRRSNLDNRLYQ